MKSIETSGKTVKDAIKLGLTELGCDSGDVDIQVIEMGSPGLFGMFGKLARVRLTVKENDRFDFKMPTMSLDEPTVKKPRGDKAKQKKEKKVAEVVEAAVAAVTPAPNEQEQRSKPSRRRGRGRSSSERETAAQPIAPVEALASEPLVEEAFVEMSYEQLSDAGKVAWDFLSGLIGKMGIEFALQTCETEGQLRFKITGENMSILIGRRGETLDALQYLTSLMINRGREDYIRVSLDTENYRLKREDALRKLALRMANRARKSGRRVALEPMNPYERRILHSALQAEPDVTTHSEGEEPYRRVVITLK